MLFLCTIIIINIIVNIASSGYFYYCYNYYFILIVIKYCFYYSWDATTGLGTPNFNIIANLVINNNSYFPNLGSYPYPQNSDPQIIYSNDDSIQYKLDYTTIISIISLILAIIGLSIIIFMLFSKGKNNNNNNNNNQRENSYNEALIDPKDSDVKIITDSEQI